MKQVVANSIQLAVEDRGHGPPVLLVHGSASAGTMWTPIIDMLKSRFRVLAATWRSWPTPSASRILS